MFAAAAIALLVTLVLVMLRGALVATVDPRQVTPEELGGYMTGGHEAAPVGAS